MGMTYESMTTAQGPSQASPEQLATAKAMLADLMRQNLTKRRFAEGGDVENFKVGASAKAGAPVHMQAGGMMSALRQALLKSGGRTAARRLERAADEIPGIEEMYTPDAIRRALQGKSGVVTIDPSEFEKYARPVISGQMTDPYIKHLMGIKGGFDEVPFLHLYKTPLGSDEKLPLITAHEGRHRSRALAGKGHKKALVQVRPELDIIGSEDVPRARGMSDMVWDSKDPKSFRKALNDELDLTGNMVRPEVINEGEKLIVRVPVDFPEVYADGGYVAPTNPLGKQAAKQKAMREEQGLTPAGALLRGLGQGMYGDVGNGMGERGYSVMDPASNAKPGREAEMQRYQDIGTALGIGSDAVPFMAMASKPVLRGAKSLATSDAAYDMLNKVLGATGGGPKHLIIGPNAKTWNKPAADLAAQMEKQGKNGDEIWQATGTFRAADGNWRQEISDANMKYTPAKAQQRQFDKVKKRYEEAKARATTPEELQEAKEWYKKSRYDALYNLKGTADEFIDHPELKAAYPELFKYKFNHLEPTHKDYTAASDTYGYFEPRKQKITINADDNYMHRPGTLHELQHAIQVLENWQSGSSVKHAMQRMADRDLAKKSLTPSDLEKYTLAQTKGLEGFTDPNKAYRSTSGEVEARMVEARRNLDEFIRKNRSPVKDYEIEPSQQITEDYAKGGAVKRAEGSPKKGETAKAPRLTDLEKLTDESKQYSQYNDLMDFLASRLAVPEISQKYLGPSTGGQFISGWGEPKNGRIELNWGATPSTLLHELTHAADRQISYQSSDLEERHRKETPLLDYLRGKTVLTPEEVRLAMGYRKLHYDPKKDYKDPARYPRQQLIKKMAPEWAKENYDYRSGDGELVAYGMGSTVPKRHYRAPLHVDPTMATEFSILLDLAQRAQKAKPPSKE
jgi:hypothetical protein